MKEEKIYYVLSKENEGYYDQTAGYWFLYLTPDCYFSTKSTAEECASLYNNVKVLAVKVTTEFPYIES